MITPKGLRSTGANSKNNGTTGTHYKGSKNLMSLISFKSNGMNNSNLDESRDLNLIYE